MNDVESLYRGRFLELQRDGRWEFVSRTNSVGAVFVLAVTDDDEIVLVEQYRVPLRAHCIELPAGMIGDEHDFRSETVFESALRELEEETGFRGREVDPLMSGPVAAGLTSEMLHLVRVRGLQRVHAGGGVDGENIRVHVVPLREIDCWLQNQHAAGRLIEPRIYAALYFARRPVADR
ncbi:NUDIX hydrolase [Fontimonas sp. SYSU GA230001]|uniref:NUDIX hydrolase n=1 Tax=Fontimonas sp. SYSU GA230001 TaxID=3142450 RepID=UPI0032B5358D